MVIFKLRRLWAALAVYENGSVLKAAGKLHMSQPAVTSAVAACERDLGAGLFDRSAAGMTPTRAGEVWFPRITAAASHLRDAESALVGSRRRPSMPLHRLVGENQLRSLSAMIETGSFSEAARRLGIAQPSVHRASRDLQTLCGVPLWRRRGKNVEPTHEALVLARHADLCFSEVATAYEAVREIQGIIQGTLRIGALPLARSAWLPGSLSETLAHFPDARVSILDGPYSEQLSALRHGRIDFLLGALRPRAPDGVVQLRVFSDPVVIVVRHQHPLSAGFDSVDQKLTREQLAGLGWILPPVGTPGRANFEKFLADRGVRSPQRLVECSSLVATRELLLRSDYAAILSAHQVQGEVSAGILKVMGPPLTGSERDIGITIRGGFLPTELHTHFMSVLQSKVSPSQ